MQGRNGWLARAAYVTDPQWPGESFERTLPPALSRVLGLPVEELAAWEIDALPDCKTTSGLLIGWDLAFTTVSTLIEKGWDWLNLRLAPPGETDAWLCVDASRPIPARWRSSTLPMEPARTPLREQDGRRAALLIGLPDQTARSGWLSPSPETDWMGRLMSIVAGHDRLWLATEPEPGQDLMMASVLMTARQKGESPILLCQSPITRSIYTLDPDWSYYVRSCGKHWEPLVPSMPRKPAPLIRSACLLQSAFYQELLKGGRDG